MEDRSIQTRESSQVQEDHAGTCIWVGQHHHHLKTASQQEADVPVAEGLEDSWDLLKGTDQCPPLGLQLLLLQVGPTFSSSTLLEAAPPSAGRT